MVHIIPKVYVAGDIQPIYSIEIKTHFVLLLNDSAGFLCVFINLCSGLLGVASYHESSDWF